MQRTNNETTREKRSAIEQRIIEAAVEGTEADFSHLTDKDGKRLRVSGAFISSLLKGEVEGAQVSASGLLLRGLTIEGQVDLSERDGRDGGLRGLRAIDCDFTDCIDLLGTHIAWLVLDHVHIAGGEIGGSPIALRLYAATVSLDVQIAWTTANSAFDLSSARVGLNMTIDRLRVTAPLDFWAIDLSDTSIGGRLTVSRCKFSGGLLASGMEVGKGVHLTRTMLDQAALVVASADFSNSRIGGWLVVDTCRARGSIDLDGIVVTQFINMLRVKISVSDGERIALPIRQSSCSAIALRSIKLEGSLVLAATSVAGACLIENLTADILTPQNGGPTVYEQRGTGADTGRAINLYGLTIGSNLEMKNVLADGGIIAARLQCAGHFEQLTVQASSVGSLGSVIMTGSRIGGIFSLRGCSFSNGLSAPMIEAEEIQIEGCDFGSMEFNRFDRVALWLGSVRVRRNLIFGPWRPPGAVKARMNRFAGRCRLEGMAIGNTILIDSSSIAVRGHPNEIGDRSAVILDGSKVGRHVMLADLPHEGDYLDAEDRMPATISGCVSLDDAEIEGDVVIHRCQITASGDIIRPEDLHGPIERITEQKAGVALSMRKAIIRGVLVVRQAPIVGLIDLRAANVGALHDGCGRNWGQVGFGRLMLDGLVYGDLDDPQSASAGRRRGAPSHADARLAWLDLQHEDGTPTAASFNPQPYEQLARFFSSKGNEHARRQVLIAKRDRQRRYGGFGVLDKVTDAFLRMVSNYGYSTGRASLSVILLLTLGSLAATYLDSNGALVVGEGGNKALSAIPYAIDVAVPILDFANSDAVHIDASKLAPPLNRQWLIDIFLGTYQLFGLIIVSIAVLTFTGILREKD